MLSDEQRSKGPRLGGLGMRVEMVRMDDEDDGLCYCGEPATRECSCGTRNCATCASEGCNNPQCDRMARDV